MECVADLEGTVPCHHTQVQSQNHEGTVVLQSIELPAPAEALWGLPLLMQGMKQAEPFGETGFEFANAPVALSVKRGLESQRV